MSLSQATEFPWSHASSSCYLPVLSTSVELSDVALEPIFELIGGANASDAFLAVNRQWFNAGACHAAAFRTPVQQWRNDMCQQLEEQLIKHMHEPPNDKFASLNVAVDYAENELHLTHVSAVFLKKVTVEFFHHVRRLSSMLKWIHTVLPQEVMAGMTTPARYRYVCQEKDEFHARAAQLCSVVRDLLVRLPDPALPVRWAEWFEEMGRICVLPEEHCARYRSQREQVAVLWANNRQTFINAYVQLEPLVSAFGMLQDESIDAWESRCRT